MAQSSPSLDDCIKLLKGERDEQRLAGLLLVTKFCDKDDHLSIRRVYDAVGPQFLHRLLKTGMGKGSGSGKGGANEDAYLQLSVTVLAAFCRVPDIAASQDMVAKIPLILEIMSKESGSSVVEDCYEILYLVSSSHQDGVTVLYESGGMNVLSSHMATLQDGSHTVELAIRLVQLMTSKLSLDFINQKYSSELSMMVATIAKQFAVLHNALKFEALHLLSAILSSKHSAPVHDRLRLMKNGIWSSYIRIGVVAILQNRVAPQDKLHALILAESVISIVGEGWLIGEMNLPDMQDPIPADRCILLVLESSRIEIAVLLNELAYLKYETSQNSSANAETIPIKQRNLGVAFSLVEKIIKLISNIGEDEDTGSIISESTFSKIISGLNETIGLVLEYLQDAKDHGQRKGDDLLASVRIIGSYLAETPVACEQKVRELLEYMISIEGEDEPSPFYSICFLLPFLCQITMAIDGCIALASSGAYKAVVDCLIKLVGLNHVEIEDDGSIFLACDTILNLLLKREQIRVPLDDSIFVKLLGALAYWTENTGDATVIMMASSICALIFDSTSERALMNHPDFKGACINSLSQLIRRSLTIGQDVMSDGAKADADLHHIVVSGYSRWADRFLHVKEAVER
ncbi:hypothetical protein LguiB_027524 [Lonicera macranthoides]